MKFIVIALSISIFAVACGNEDMSEETNIPVLPETVQPTLSAGVEVMEVSVGPQLESCVGSYPMMCMVVDGDLFYDDIEGFTFEAGYEYELRIEQYDRWPDTDEPPQDAGKYGYRLIEVIQKTSVQ